MLNGMQVGVGRDASRPICLTDPSISRDHAQFVMASGTWWLWDNKSTNGTMCNGKMVTDPVQLSDGDELKFGTVMARYVAAESQDGTTFQLPPIAD